MNGLEEIQKTIGNFAEKSKQTKQQIAQIKNGTIKKYCEKERRIGEQPILFCHKMFIIVYKSFSFLSAATGYTR